MKEIPILFSTEMVRAILEGRKSQTRRVIKRIPCQCGEWMPEELPNVTDPEGWLAVDHSVRWWCETCTSEQDVVHCPYGKPGDVLWVRERFARVHGRALSIGVLEGAIEAGASTLPDATEPQHVFVYRSDFERLGIKNPLIWKPSIHMPRSACRLFLRVKDVRVERLKDISEADAIAEGVRRRGRNSSGQTLYENYLRPSFPPFPTSAITSFSMLWNNIHAPRNGWHANPWVWVVVFERIENYPGLEAYRKEVALCS